MLCCIVLTNAGLLFVGEQNVRKGSRGLLKGEAGRVFVTST